MTNYIDDDECMITCEEAAELQLQQPHVVRLETRPPNLEGNGAITMRDLVRNCLRMRPERIIVGEVRGPEAFDLLQAMNTGHDGSMGTLHANSPREAISRLKELGDGGKGKKQSLEARIAQAGLSWSRKKFFVASLVSAALLGTSVSLAGVHWLVVVPAVCIGGFGLPAWALNSQTRPTSSSGASKRDCPLGECLRVIATEAAEPVRSEFRQIVEAQAMGFSTGEAVERIVERVPIPEASFF